jgi:hypothetical protein
MPALVRFEAADHDRPAAAALRLRDERLLHAIVMTPQPPPTLHRVDATGGSMQQLQQIPKLRHARTLSRAPQPIDASPRRQADPSAPGMTAAVSEALG